MSAIITMGMVTANPERELAVRRPKVKWCSAYGAIGDKDGKTLPSLPPLIETDVTVSEHLLSNGRTGIPVERRITI